MAELRQAIECANANATDDVIDLGGHTLVLTDAPYSNAHGDTALPFITSVLELQNGQLERDGGAPPFRLILSDSSGALTVRDMQLRGGSASGEGGAILSLSANPLMVRTSVFENNSATSRGGAVSSQGPSQIVMSDFTGNTAPDGAALAAYQMAMAINNRFFANGDAGSDSVLWNDNYGALLGSLFADNHLAASGSSLMVFTSNTLVAEMRHMTIADNVVQGPLLRIENGNTVQVRNSILWNNTSAGLGDITPWYSLFPGAPAADGNLDADPLFVATPGNYRLAANSPAIDAGDNANSWIDNFDIDDDGNSSELLPDLDLSPRPWDDPDVPDTGAGTAPIVDIGAYERQPPVALPTLNINDVSVNEGDSGTTDAVFTISLSAPAPLGGTAFDIATTDGTATTADNDYVAQSLTAVLIPAGQSSTTLTVQVNGDTTVEPDETFFVNVTNIVNAVAGDAQGLGTIVNDDADPCAGFSFPYTLSGANNAARVANLRQAIHCANANATDDVIDMAGATLVFDAPDASTFDESALPNVTSVITLRNGTLQRDAAAADFRLLTIEGSGELVGESLDFRNGLASVGAAIYSDGDLTLHDVGFFDNGDLAVTGQGGAIHHGGNTLRIIDSRFERNAATSGGAVSISTGDLWMRGSLLQDNQADEGGALYSESIMIRLFDNVFVANQARRGGAIKCFGGRISGTRFEDNTADELAGAVYMEFAFVDLFVSNSLFIGNEAPDGAALVGADTMTNLHNITISGHPGGAGDLLRSDGEIVIANSIVWGNGGASLGTATVRHSLIEGGYPGGTDIIDLDPRFIDAANGDYRLASGSPAIDAGNNADVRRDTWMDIDEDGDVDEELEDLDGNPRRHDDAGVVDTGLGTAPIVDLGAYERQT
ncbi:MAG: Calx-beta domain-containing protein, partial [Lysobacteraceae bacterium]